MSRGLYYTENNTNFCGTFYYNEPESSTYLAYKTAFVAFNKTDAYEKLSGIYGRYRYGAAINKIIRDHISGVIPADFILTPDQVLDFDSLFSHDLQDREYRRKKLPEGYPARYEGNLFVYAVENALD